MLLDIIETVDTKHSTIGKLCQYVDPSRDVGELIKFSSTLENVGLILDRKLVNHSYCMIIADNEIAIHPTVGAIDVTKIFCNQEMWVKTCCLIEK